MMEVYGTYRSNVEQIREAMNENQVGEHIYLLVYIYLFDIQYVYSVNEIKLKIPCLIFNEVF
jgi:hypothetical protein